MKRSRTPYSPLAALSRLLMLTLCAASVLAVTVPAAGQTASPQLIITSTSSLPGDPTAVEVRLVNPNRQVAALTFSIEFDVSRLAFDATGANGQLAAVETSLPSPFRVSAFYFPDQARVGISIYSARTPVAPIPDGLVVRIHFTVKQDASGFAFVRLDPTPGPDAADLMGDSISLGVQSSQSGVSVAAGTSLLSLAPQQLSFGSVPVGQTMTRELVVGNSGSAPLALEQIHLAGGASPFAIVSAPVLPDPLTGGSSTVIRLSFAPGTPGDFQDVLIISTSANSEARVPLAASATPADGVALQFRSVIPLISRGLKTPGDGSVSSLTIFNPGTTSASVHFSLHQPGTNEVRTATLEIAARHAEHFDDAIQSLFGDIEAAGALVVETSSADLVLRSTAWNLPASGGRMGQSIPAIGWSELPASGRTMRLIGIDRKTSDGSSVTLMNLSDGDAVVHARVLRADGSLAGERDYSLRGGEVVGSLDLFEALGIGEASNLIIELSTETPGGVFYAYRSTVDNRTGARLFESVR